jgi:FRG domain
MPIDPIATRRFDTADMLIAAFHPDSPLWGKASRNLWIFRGHGDSDWKLLPTAYRAESWAKFDSQLIDGGADDDAKTHDAKYRAGRESQYLSTFMNTADKAGLLLPGDAQALRAIRRASVAAWDGEWPDEDVLPSLALAQHHGVPTRLLDWTWRPQVAAYFAAEAFLNPDHKAERGCIWAFSTLYASPEIAMPGEKDVRIVLVPAPQATNPNLSAQAGTFTLDLEPAIAPLDEVIGRVDLGVFNKSYHEHEPHRETPLLYKIEFPREIAPQVLRLLNYDGVNAASIYPGYDGVVRKMREHRGWIHKVPPRW